MDTEATDGAGPGGPLGWLGREWREPFGRMRLASIAFILSCLALFSAKLAHERWLPGAKPQPEEHSEEFKRAQNLLISGKVLTARNLLGEYTERNPDVAMAHLLLARTHSELGEVSEGIDQARTAAALAPELVEARIFLAHQYRLIGWDAKALEELDAVLEMVPDHLEALTLRIEIGYSSGRHKEALADGEYAVRVHPDNPVLHSLLGKMLLNAGRFDEAIPAFGRVIALDEGRLRSEARQLLVEARRRRRGQ